MIYSGTIDISNRIPRTHYYDINVEPQDIFKEIQKYSPDRLIAVSAVGSINPLYQVGDIVVIEDYITLFCPSPLVGPRFVDMSRPFDKELFVEARKYADHAGVHVFCKGPHYESFADKKVLRMLGADVVGMSMTPEIISALALGIPCIGIGVVSNLAFVKHDHESVKAEMKKKEKDIVELCEKIEGLQFS